MSERPKEDATTETWTIRYTDNPARASMAAEILTAHGLEVEVS